MTPESSTPTIPIAKNSFISMDFLVNLLPPNYTPNWGQEGTRTLSAWFTTKDAHRLHYLPHCASGGSRTLLMVRWFYRPPPEPLGHHGHLSAAGWNRTTVPGVSSQCSTIELQQRSLAWNRTTLSEFKAQRPTDRRQGKVRLPVENRQPSLHRKMYAKKVSFCFYIEFLVEFFFSHRPAMFTTGCASEVVV